MIDRRARGLPSRQQCGANAILVQSRYGRIANGDKPIPVEVARRANHGARPAATGPLITVRQQAAHHVMVQEIRDGDRQPAVAEDRNAYERPFRHKRTKDQP